MPVFGKTAAQHQVDREEMADDVWIKGFKEGTTKLRILDEPDVMITVRMHYDESHKIGFPCTEDSSECVGCKSDSAKTRDRNRQYLFNALDANGRIGLFRIGGRLWRTLQGRQQRSPNSTICDKDLFIIRTGRGMNDTNYDVEGGARYPIDLSEIEKYDIQEVLGEKYEMAAAAFNGVDPQDVQGESEKGQQAAKPAEAAQPASDGRIQPVGKKTRTETTVTGVKIEVDPDEKAPWEDQESPASTPDEPVDEGQQEATDSAAWMHETPADMSTKGLKEFLDKAGVEYPANAVRSRLVKLADKWKMENLQSA